MALLALAVFLGLQLYSLNAGVLLHNQLPMPCGFGVAVVLSGSMEPSLSVNDLVFLRAAESVSVGDVVVYQSGDELIIHRVVQTHGAMLTTQGDANNTADAPIALADVKGVMFAQVPYVGAAVRALKTPLGILAVLVAAFVLLELSYRREHEHDSRQRELIQAEIMRLRAQQVFEDVEGSHERPLLKVAGGLHAQQEADGSEKEV